MEILEKRDTFAPNLKNMVKAIFFDIDGTLVSFNTHTVPPSAVEALAELKKTGIKVFIATGRALSQIDTLGDLTFDGYITLNGAYCVNAAHEVIHKSVIPREDIEALIRYQEENERFAVALMTPEEMTVNYVDERVIELARLVNLPLPQVKDFHETDWDEVLQMDIYVDKDKEGEIMRKALTRCQSSRWNPVFADVNLRGVNKQTGIDRILEHYGIDLSETMAFGDGGNDIPMLRHVAVGIAMGNAADEVKRVADCVTDSVDDHGIRNALQRFSLISGS